MSTLVVTHCPRKIIYRGKNLLRQKELVRRSAIAVAVREIITRLEARLYYAGIRYQFKAKTSWTGSIYLKITVFSPDGVRLTHRGASVRISDHSERKGGEGTCQFANFSRPAQRYFGIDSDATSGEISRKVEMIVGGIVKRYADALEGGAI